MEQIVDFILLSDPNVRYVVLGSWFLGISAGALGCFTVLRKQALIGDAVAHAVLPGVCLAFLITQAKDPFILLLGALVSGWIAVLAMQFISKKTRIPSDASIAMVLSVFFGFGILLLTMIQQSGVANQSGLDKFLFGQAASMLPRDVWVFGIISVVVLTVLYIFFKELKLISFNPEFAASIGISATLLDGVLTTLLVCAITVGIQAVGVVLMASLLITPAVAARYWTEDLKIMVFLAGGFGALSSWLGAFISYLYPGMPTGPWVVVAVTIIFLFSMLFAPERGIVARWQKRQHVNKRIQLENILKTFYQLDEPFLVENTSPQVHTVDEFLAKRPLKAVQIGLRQLEKKGMLTKRLDGWQLTPSGVKEGKRVARLHRLWELYLTHSVQIPPDHVHDDAEAMEHVLTPELEATLTKILKNPSVDPHQSPIPYD